MMFQSGSQLDFNMLTPGIYPSLSGYDEVVGDDGFIRSHWRGMMDFLARLGPSELTDRSESGRRIIREQGVSCYIPGEGKGGDRPWELDILPLVIDSREWRKLEAGLIQRTRLLNLVLRDLYSSQHTLRNGWLPAPVVYANPNFLRGCQAVKVPGNNYIPFYAVDLGRSPDGRWWVLADRTQSPSGVGFALENRAIVSRVLPEAAQQLQPHFVGGMLPLIRETLLGLTPNRRDNPTVVVLTPGQHHEAYFEHTYLARIMGFALVEGGDLTVRDRRVYIKTLEGLREVDVILRRVSDSYCDPLEFRGDSLLGVPGLLEAVRAGNVSLANALGSGLVESPAFMAFLPTLCRALLAEELQIPSVATWWCGEPPEQQYVSQNVDFLHLRRAFSLMGLKEQDDFANTHRDVMRRKVAARPYDYVGQEELILSHLPALYRGQVASAPFILRAFVVSDGESIRVMPGGLVRMPERERVTSLALSLAGGNKDAWALWDGVTISEPISVSVAPEPFVERDALELPSRTADNLFWLGRYTERLESVARIGRCAIASVTSDFGASGRKRLTALSGLLREIELLDEKSRASDLRDRMAEGLVKLVSDPGLSGGVADLMNRIHSTAFAVRDRLSGDTWRLLRRLEGDSHGQSAHRSLIAGSSVLDTLILDLAAFNGMENENMTRGHGWVFLDFGRRLERSLNLVQIMDFLIASGDNISHLLEPTLEICDSVITYRLRHFAEMRLPGVARLLLLEHNNPRSLAFQLVAMERHAAGLPEEPNPEGVWNVRQRISSMAARLYSMDLGDVERYAAYPQSTWQNPLSRYGFAGQLGEVSDLLTQVYFSHVVPMVS